VKESLLRVYPWTATDASTCSTCWTHFAREAGIHCIQLHGEGRIVAIGAVQAQHLITIRLLEDFIQRYGRVQLDGYGLDLASLDRGQTAAKTQAAAGSATEVRVWPTQVSLNFSAGPACQSAVS